VENFTHERVENFTHNNLAKLLIFKETERVENFTHNNSPFPAGYPQQKALLLIRVRDGRASILYIKYLLRARASLRAVLASRHKKARKLALSGSLACVGLEWCRVYILPAAHLGAKPRKARS